LPLRLGIGTPGYIADSFRVIAAARGQREREYDRAGQEN
jgi:hypothetical protein